MMKHARAGLFVQGLASLAMRFVVNSLLVLCILAAPAAAQVPDAYRSSQPHKRESIGIPVPPAAPRTLGDSFTNPIPILSLPFYEFGNSCAFANNLQGACGGTGPDVVYAFTPTQNVTVNISLCDPFTNFDTVLDLFRNSSSTPVSCSDDYCNLASGIRNVTLFAGNTYFVVVDGFAGACGNYRLTLDAAGPACNVVFPPDGIPEPEAICVDGYVDRSNAGCNSDPPTWTDVPCSSTPITLSGHYGNFVTAGNSFRDTDWYRIVANQPTTVSATLNSEVDGVIAILDLSGGCANVRVLAPTSGPSLSVPACTPVTCSAAVQPGEYFVFVAPAAFAGIPASARYTLMLSGVPCTRPAAIDLGLASGAITSATGTVTVPISLRGFVAPSTTNGVRNFVVTVSLSSGLKLGTPPAVTAGTYLTTGSCSGSTADPVPDAIIVRNAAPNDNTYTITGSLHSPACACGASGPVFNLRLGTTRTTGSSTELVQLVAAAPGATPTPFMGDCTRLASLPVAYGVTDAPIQVDVTTPATFDIGPASPATITTTTGTVTVPITLNQFTPPSGVGNGAKAFQVTFQLSAGLRFLPNLGQSITAGTYLTGAGNCPGGGAGDATPLLNAIQNADGTVTITASLNPTKCAQCATTAYPTGGVVFNVQVGVVAGQSGSSTQHVFLRPAPVGAVPPSPSLKDCLNSATLPVTYGVTDAPIQVTLQSPTTFDIGTGSTPSITTTTGTVTVPITLSQFTPPSGVGNGAKAFQVTIALSSGLRFATNLGQSIQPGPYLTGAGACPGGGGNDPSPILSLTVNTNGTVTIVAALNPGKCAQCATSTYPNGGVVFNLVLGTTLPSGSTSTGHVTLNPAPAGALTPSPTLKDCSSNAPLPVAYGVTDAQVQVDLTTPTTIDLGPASGAITSATGTVTVPISLRGFVAPSTTNGVRNFVVTVLLSSGLKLATPPPAVTAGTYLTTGSCNGSTADPVPDAIIVRNAAPNDNTYTITGSLHALACACGPSGPVLNLRLGTTRTTGSSTELVQLVAAAPGATPTPFMGDCTRLASLPVAYGVTGTPIQVNLCSAPLALTVTATPSTFWPPDRKLHDIHVTSTVTGGCGPVSVVLRSITASCPPGDHSHKPDVVGAAFNTPDFDFQLRARNCPQRDDDDEDECEDRCEARCVSDGRGSCDRHCDQIPDRRQREHCRREQRECLERLDERCDRVCEAQCELNRDLIYTIVFQASSGGGTATATTTVRIQHDRHGHASIAADVGGAVAPHGTPLSPTMSLVIPSIPRAVGPEGNGTIDAVDLSQGSGLGRPRLRFDGSTIDPEQIFVGNSSGFIPVRAIRIADTNGDGFQDLVATLQSSETRAIQSLPANEDDPITLFYSTLSGTGYEVIGLFGLDGRTAAVTPPGGELSSKDDGSRSQAGALTPRTTQLGAIHPNPSRDQLSFTVELSSRGEARLEVFDLRGALVRTLMQGSQPAGRYDLSWDGLDNIGRRAPSGLYLVRMQAGAYRATRSAMLVR